VWGGGGNKGKILYVVHGAGRGKISKQTRKKSEMRSQPDIRLLRVPDI
jgi:hypothetical protein